jgi:hypothetical protein
MKLTWGDDWVELKGLFPPHLGDCWWIAILELLSLDICSFFWDRCCPSLVHAVVIMLWVDCSFWFCTLLALCQCLKQGLITFAWSLIMYCVYVCDITLCIHYYYTHACVCVYICTCVFYMFICVYTVYVYINICTYMQFYLKVLGEQNHLKVSCRKTSWPFGSKYFGLISWEQKHYIPIHKHSTITHSRNGIVVLKTWSNAYVSSPN